MKTGNDPRFGPLTVADYVKQYGPKVDERGERQRPQLKCPACGGTLHTVGETTAVRDAIWAHDPDLTRVCAIKESGAPKYTLLKPTQPDEAAGKLLRSSFFVNWQQHFAHIRKVAPYAGVETFIAFIKYADKVNLWANKGLQEVHLPYVCLVTCEFPPPKGKAAVHRSKWLRFCFEEKLRTLEDLWIRIHSQLDLLVLIYRKPRSGAPTGAHFEDWKAMSLDLEWMGHPFAPSLPHAVAEMLQHFPEELKPTASKT